MSSNQRSTRSQPAAALLLLLAAATPALARAEDPYRPLREGAKKIKTLRASFEQRKSIPILVKPLISRGKFAYAAPASARWEYVSPLRAVTLVHQGDVSRLVQREGKLVPDAATDLRAMKVVLEQMTAWMAGRFDGGDKAFSAMLAPGPPAVVTLTPRDKALARFIRKVRLTFSDTPGVVREVRIEESGEAVTTLTFSDVKVNEKLPDDTFQRPAR